MLGDISGVENLYLITGATDMRKSIDGLCAVVEQVVRRDTKSNALFLFCGRQKDRIKALTDCLFRIIRRDDYTKLHPRFPLLQNRSEPEQETARWTHSVSEALPRRSAQVQ